MESEVQFGGMLENIGGFVKQKITKIIYAFPQSAPKVPRFHYPSQPGFTLKNADAQPVQNQEKKRTNPDKIGVELVSNSKIM